jgi:hypothetical protein
VTAFDKFLKWGYNRRILDTCSCPDVSYTLSGERVSRLNWFAVAHHREDLSPLCRGLDPSGHHPHEDHVDIARLLGSLTAGAVCSGVYFGSEFCERLLPTPGELESALEETRARDLALVLLTPPLTDWGIDRLARILEVFCGEEGGEIVCNDWGALAFVRENFPCARPILGRLMSKMLREVRIAAHLAPGKAPEGALRALMDCGYGGSDYADLLAQFGVGRLEFDIPPQGLGVHLPDGLRGSVYVPFGFVSTGRICMPGSLRLPVEKKFTPQAACGKECTRWFLRLREENRSMQGNPPFLSQRGNTVFFLEEASLLAQVLSEGHVSGIDRVVVDNNVFA